MNNPIERINVNFPRPVVEDLRRLVPAKRRSEVIARATARELRRLKLAALFEESDQGPQWKADEYPQLEDGPAISRFVAQMRAAGTYVRPTTPVTETPAATTRLRRKARRE